MSALSLLNPNAKQAEKDAAFQVNATALKGLAEVLKTSFGPRGQWKMLVSGAGEIKITKDGNTLLMEMQVQHPTAQMVARAVTAQDDMLGDGTKALILFCNELMRQAEWRISAGVHPRRITEGFQQAAELSLAYLRDTAIAVSESVEDKREKYVQTAYTCLNTKLEHELAQQMAEICVDAVSAIHTPGEMIDLHMVEVMHMQHKSDASTRLIRGLVLDHGSRHAAMPTRLENCYILTCNVNLEWDKTEINSEWNYHDAETKERMARAEKKTVEDRTQIIIDLKRRLCTAENGKSFVVINQKGVDLTALDMLSKEGIIALRRAKRRNMERLTLACGGNAVNHLEGLDESDLGFAGKVYEHILGEDKYTFVEDVKNSSSCTILINGRHGHQIARLKEAVRDGLRSVRNTIEDKSIVPGAGSFERSLSKYLKEQVEKAEPRQKIGIEVFADAILFVPQTLAANSGKDVAEALTQKDEDVAGVYDSTSVKAHWINSAAALVSQLLLTDEIIRASSGKTGGAAAMEPDDE